MKHHRINNLNQYFTIFVEGGEWEYSPVDDDGMVFDKVNEEYRFMDLFYDTEKETYIANIYEAIPDDDDNWQKGDMLEEEIEVIPVVVAPAPCV